MSDTQIDWRSMVKDADAAAQSAQLQVAASRIAWIADVTISYTSALSLSLTPRVKTLTALDAATIGNAQIDDRVYVHRHGYPTAGGINVLSGVMIEGTGYVPANGSVEIYHIIPAVSLNQALLIPLRLVAYRAAT